MKIILISVITFYQLLLSPIFKIFIGTDKFCRFEESCSNYSKRVILEQGAIKGLALTIKRISKCQPFYNGYLGKEIV